MSGKTHRRYRVIAIRIRNSFLPLILKATISSGGERRVRRSSGAKQTDRLRKVQRFADSFTS